MKKPCLILLMLCNWSEVSHGLDREQQRGKALLQTHRRSRVRRHETGLSAQDRPAVRRKRYLRLRSSGVMAGGIPGHDVASAGN